eukprot:6808364-Pyramimonas_sp.AAC.1
MPRLVCGPPSAGSCAGSVICRPCCRARAPWSELVHVGDASTEGIGACCARWDVSDAALVGRC